MWQRYTKRRLNQICRLVITITFLSLVVIIAWKTNSSGEDQYEWYGVEQIPHQEKRSKQKHYLSYQPPGGGWNNQRIAFENAVIMAIMLKRILLVQPLGPHNRILELKKQYNQSVGYAIYNMLTTKELVPISKLIDLQRLSSLLSVYEISSNHHDFIKKYNSSSWYNACHNGLSFPWVDKIPNELNSDRINFCQNFKKSGTIPKYRQYCPGKSENELAFWEFLPELRRRKEDMIYFEKGSLFVRQVFFTDYKRALSAQKTLIDWIRPAPNVLSNVAMIISTIGKPFNAIHVRRKNHKTGQRFGIQYWLSRLSKAKAIQYSEKLYVATDETNLTWFYPLTEAGYNVFFATDFDVFRRINESNPITGNDIIGFHEQVICSHANIFIHSYYSTFSWLIQRYRNAQSWDRKQFRHFQFSSVNWINTSML